MWYYGSVIPVRMETWVYLAWDAEGLPIYVGLAKDWRARIRDHEKDFWWPWVAWVQLVRTESQGAAYRMEKDLIAQYRPRANAKGNPDYHQFPRRP